MPLTILGASDVMVNKTKTNSGPHGAYILLKEEKNRRKQIRIQTVISATKSVTRAVGLRVMGDGSMAWTRSRGSRRTAWGCDF